MFSQKQLLRFTKAVFPRHPAKVSTWTALATSFNATPQRKYDFWSKNVGLFEIPCLETPEGFRTLKDDAISKGWYLLEKAVKSEPGEETIVLFDELSDTLCRVADMADFVRCAHPNSAFVDAAADAHLNIGTMVEELNTNEDLYSALKKVTQNDDIRKRLDEETRTVADLFMFDFTISGIHLNADERQKAVQLHEEILQLTAEYLQYSNSPVAFPKQQIPESLHKHFNQVNDNIIISGLHCDSPDPSVREAAYRLHYYPNPETERVLTRLLQARQQVARLVGFDSFAERTLKSTMAKTPDNVLEFLSALSAKVKPIAKTELMELNMLKASDSTPGDVMSWDLPYYIAKMKATKCSIDPVLYSSYFSLGDCMAGLNNLFKALFDVTVNPVPTQKGEVWSDDVIKLAVSNVTGDVLGHIYCDFFNRPGKPQQDCHFTIRGGRRLRNGLYQSPVVVLMLHLPSATLHQPPLLTPAAMQNLFHEMGHAIHSMLARTRYQHVTGTRCATDFAEVPSVLMEYFANDPRVLTTFAKHHKTRETLPVDMINNLCKAEKVCSVTDMQTQIFYSIMDQKVHTSPSLTEKSITTIMEEIHRDHYSLPLIPDTAWHFRFSHLASYGAKYYSYLMSRAVASRLWSKCFIDDPFNKEMGARFRDEMLQHGGGKDPVAMYENMFKEQLHSNMLVDTLLEDVQRS